MQRWTGFMLAVLCCAAVVLLAGGRTEAGTIAGTGHDFSTRGASGLCITCHGVHKVPNTPLLWNHTLSAQNFSWSDYPATVGGTPTPTNLRTWSGSTKMCLSCHDGTVDVGSLMSGTSFTGGKAPAITGAAGDLKGNHPVGIPYPYNGARNTYNGSTTGVNTPVSEYRAVPTKVKMFTDPTVAANNTGIECGSCHNPHDNSNGDFLRDAKLTICQNCHVK